MTTTDATSSVPLTDRPAWQALREHQRQIEPVHLRTLFAEDPARGERLVGLGAVRVRVVNVAQSGTTTWTVLQDPDGNELCVVQRPT